MREAAAAPRIQTLSKHSRYYHSAGGVWPPLVKRDTGIVLNISTLRHSWEVRVRAGLGRLECFTIYLCSFKFRVWLVAGSVVAVAGERGAAVVTRVINSQARGSKLRSINQVKTPRPPPH